MLDIQIIYIPSMYWIYLWIVIPQVFVYFFPFTKLSNKQHKCCYNWSLSLVFGNTVKLCCSIFILFMIFHANTALHTLSVLISTHLVWWFDWLAIIFKTRKLTYRDRWFHSTLWILHYHYNGNLCVSLCCNVPHFVLSHYIPVLTTFVDYFHTRIA